MEQTDVLARTKYEESFLVFFKFPNHPRIHIAICILAAVLCIDVQVYHQVDFEQIRKHVEQNMSINEYPSLAFMLVAIFMMYKRSFRNSMDLLRSIKDENGNIVATNIEMMEAAVRDYYMSWRGMLEKLVGAFTIMIITALLTNISFLIMAKIF